MAEVVLFHIEKNALYGSLDKKKLGYFNPPMGLAYIASVLEKNNHSVRLFDLPLTNDPFKKAKEVLKKESPKFVGITCTTPNFFEVCRLSSLVKEVNKEIKTVVGGPHPSALPREVLKNKDIDFVAVGEGEHIFLELVEGRNLKTIRGLAYKQNKKIRINPTSTLIKDLDKLPFPAFHQLDLSLYGEPHRPKAMSIIGSRGCPFNCIFCADKVIHKRVRVRSPKNIVDEIEFLHNRYGIKNFSFFDEVFTIYRDRCINICLEIMKRKLKIDWYCASRVDSVDKELLQVMKRAGCKLVEYGIESGNQNILNIIKKNITLAQIEKAVHLTNQVGLSSGGLFMLGNPYETEDTIQDTLSLAKKLPLKYAIFNITMPLPGTELWKWSKEGKGIKLLTQDWKRFKAYENPIIELPQISQKRLSQLQKKAYKIFYFRPSYVFKRLISQPKDLLKDVKKLPVMLKFIW